MNTEQKPLIGAHVSFKKEDQLLGSIRDFLAIDATSGAFYISNSRAYKKTMILDQKKLQEAKELATKNKFNLKNIIVHAPLVGNLANIEQDQKTYILTRESYLDDLKLMEKIGLSLFNFHPGSAKDKKLGIKKCAEGINYLIEHTKNDHTIVCIETMMKKGNYIGSNFSEIKEIINLVINKKRVGVIIDTCHIWDAGYDLNDFDNVLKQFEMIIGLKYLKGLHINDSKNPLGSNKDRHANIGKGYIGLKNLKNIIFHPKIINLPKALETPYGKDDFKRWKEEISLLLN
ncbi:MAG: putative endonuclease 4 [Candidatus Hepatoplasma scabrum]|nr:MAG: putative endonuclease 4 [Candidatus Hepatoplasma sp.]